MADSTVTMGNYGDRLQLFGLTNSTFDTKALLDATIATMELKNVPYKNQLTAYEEELGAWKNLKLQLEALNKTVEELKSLTTEDQKVTISDPSALTIKASSSAYASAYKIEIEQLAKAHKVKSNAIAEPLNPLNMEGTFKINNQTIDITSDMTLKDIVAKVNQTEGIGVNAVVVNNTIVFTSTKSGVENAIAFEDGTGDVLKQLGILDETNQIAFGNEVQKAQDAKLTVDGIAITSSTNEITNVIDGISFTLLKETNGSIEATVEKNNELLKEKTEKFVNDFNTIIRYLNSITGKEAILQGKTVPIRAKSDMVSAITQQTNSKLMMYDIGISIDGIAKDGTIKLDTEKLAKQLAEKPDEVMKLLTGSGSITDFVSKKLANATNATGSLTSTIEGIEKRMSGVKDTISKNEERFEMEQQMLLKKFAMYEVTMNSLNTQKKYIEAQIEAMMNQNK